MDKLDIKRLAKKETKAKVTTYAIVVGAVLILYTLSMFFVLGWGFINSFKYSAHFDLEPLALPDFKWFKTDPDYDGMIHLIANYQMFITGMAYEASEEYFTMWSTEPVYHAVSIMGFEAFLFFLWNSVQTVFAGTCLPVYLCCIMGYLATNYKYKFSRFLYALVMFVMIVPVIGSGSSMLNLQKTIGFYDNMICFFIWNCQFTSMYFLMMFAFFEGLSATYFEAAEIDGASQLRLIISIAIPMANTMIWASIVSLIVTTWNDYMTPLTYLPSHPTLAFGIWYNTRMLNVARASIPPQLASAFILATPSLIFFIVFRKKLMGNISIGGIKG